MGKSSRRALTILVAIALAGLAVIPAQAVHVDPTMVPGGSTCTTVGTAGLLSLRINEPTGESTTTVGTATFTLTVHDRKSFSFDTDGTAFVYDVIVKGSAANHYDFDGDGDGPVTSHGNLSIPNGNKLNHVEFCYDAAPAEPETFSVSGFKYHDLNASGGRDGVGESQEPGLSGWTITVNEESAATTAADGSYSLEGLDAGDVVCEVAPAEETDWIQSEPLSGCYTVEGDQTDADFGNYKNGAISGTKTDGEVGLGGWIIFIDGNENGELDEEEQSTTTSSEGEDVGSYTLSGLTPGDYDVCEVLQEGYDFNDPDDGCHEGVTVTSGQTTSDVNFSNHQVFGISGTKYNDLNASGDNEDELGIGGWTIYLFESDGETANLLEQTTTDEAGSFLFEGLSPGNYIVCEAPTLGEQTNWQQSEPANSACDGLAELALAPGGHTVQVGGDDPTSALDFGNFQGETLVCGDPVSTTSDDGATTGEFTRVPGDGAPACEDGKTAFLDASDDGVITFIPFGSTTAFFEGILTFTKASTADDALILEYDREDSGIFVAVPDCVFEGGEAQFPDSDPHTWCVESATATRNLGSVEPNWTIVWNVLGVGDPKFR